MQLLRETRPRYEKNETGREGQQSDLRARREAGRRPWLGGDISGDDSSAAAPRLSDHF